MTFFKNKYIELNIYLVGSDLFSLKKEISILVLKFYTKYLHYPQWHYPKNSFRNWSEGSYRPNLEPQKKNILNQQSDSEMSRRRQTGKHLAWVETLARDIYDTIDGEHRPTRVQHVVASCVPRT